MDGWVRTPRHLEFVLNGLMHFAFKKAQTEARVTYLKQLHSMFVHWNETFHFFGQQ